ncbi:oligoendopeptidase F [Roseateles saccharophilus]|uniref:Oligopeptidase F n=1 Tax=Roseateles saccharophilus TaxID=304 RepID=A0A4R3UHC1_ROSSA|nr:oligoendopeptidase F [Roseateles saccharophilus]MDG0835027.1 oligoendopeptidase F [Roseateles saccharophilus]TCU88329.1 oligopeptidase F [Roseateles saccharophilus]
MNRSTLPRALALSLVLALGGPAAVHADQLPAVWDLSPLYASDTDWETARKSLLADLPNLAALKGTLGKSAKSLLAGLDAISAANLRFDRLRVYASMKQSTDNRDAKNQERSSLAGQLGGEFGSALAWVEPELQSLGEAKVAAYLKAEPGLKKHAEHLRNSLRQAKHTLSAESEAVIAALAPVRGATGDARTLLFNADTHWPELTVDGKTERLDDTKYGLLRQNPDRAVRKQVFDAFFGAIGQYENTYGVTLGNVVQDDTIMAKLRHYPSAVAMSLGGEEVPEAVYRTLVAEVHKGLPTLHRYFKLRQKMLGLPDLHYYDIYPALVTQKKTYSLDDAAALTLAATKPLGEDYQALLKTTFKANTMHALPSPGKSGGAYQDGAYGAPPFVFLNHQGDFESVSTFAHEWGHAMHTAMANRAQPYETAGYSTFIAEIASTANEVLLSNYMRGQAASKEEKLYQLGYALERLRGTFFRQAMFGEFELNTHDAAAKGEALNGKRMTEIYCKLLKDYHGDAAGVMQIDPLYCQEWAFIPHFYRPFYVYQYATSITAALHFAEDILAAKPGARENYLKLLAGGGSVAPYQALKNAGLDMASPAPYQAVIKRMDAIMDEMEALLATKG